VKGLCDPLSEDVSQTSDVNINMLIYREGGEDCQVIVGAASYFPLALSILPSLLTVM
jgi:hypothetical protein